jgi:two-component system chemotaxis response regulator CheB
MFSSPTQLIRVLVVDDSFFMRKILVNLLNDPRHGITVIDTAKNGLEAIEKNKSLKPDVITMDIEMPHMDGLSALRQIITDFPVPVVMLSAHTGKGTETTIRALEMGAVDCIRKPLGIPITDLDEIKTELIEKVKMASLTHPQKRSEDYPRGPGSRRNLNENFRQNTRKEDLSRVLAHTIVAIASSTGGPRALNELLSQIPEGFPAAIVIVQHISTGFTKALARRLDECSSLKVLETEEGQKVLTGHAYIAPAGRHLVIQGSPGNYQTHLTDTPPRMGVRPSADIMMQSVAKSAGRHSVGIILTGMGRDGALGLKEIHEAGGKTFAQDPESCVVYGMPKAAVDDGVVDQQLTLREIALATCSILSV